MKKLRLVIPEVPHHVILRGNNGRNLCSYRFEYAMFVHYLQGAAEKYECQVNALSLLPKQADLVVTPPTQKAMSNFVQWFAARYARFRNARRDGSGRLFDERFTVFPIVTEQYLAAVIAHIELSPVRADRCENPAEWPWSTYRLHTGRADLSDVPYRIWTPSPWFVGLGTHRSERFTEWIAECLASDAARREPERDKWLRRPGGDRAT
jgi:putative transposase